jgi:HK97 family phage major capsid protein
MIVKKLENLRNTLDGYLEEEDKLTKRSEEMKTAIEEAETDEELEAVEEAINELEQEKAELEEKKSKLEQEIAELEGELEQLNSNAPKNNEGGKRDMGDKLEVREVINDYVRTKQIRQMGGSGFKVDNGGVLVPEEILAPYRKPEDVVDLTKLVRVVKVNRGSGKVPVIEKSGSKMASVAELEQNPELAKPTITNVPYDIGTYRGYIPVSQEVIDDADFDVTGLIAEEISDQELNTKNDAIAAVLKTATSKTVTGLDGLKAVFNKDIKKVYNVKAVISASLYNVLDTMKDNNGRYLLQDDITLESGKRLFGKEVIVLDDDVIGAIDGDLVGFIGDLEAFCMLFDRKSASVKWVDNDIYGQLLASFVRFDVRKVDQDAGYYITFVPDTPDTSDTSNTSNTPDTLEA